MISRADILDLMVRAGGLAYEGEGVTQLQHGWQCALLARQCNASSALQLAAWLHDIGHLLSGLPGSPTLDGIDDAHEALGGRALGELFGPEVGRPVALHVAAKRCLVSVEPGYRHLLSADSQRSLELQGGPLAPDHRIRFMAMPHAFDAMRLRRWDDMAKDPRLQPGSVDEALAELASLMDAAGRNSC